MAWKFAHDGRTYSEGDVTVDQWIDICELSGTTWAFVNPLRSPKDAKAIFTVVVSDKTDMSREDAGTVIGAMSTDLFLALFTDVDDDLPEEFEDGLPKIGGRPFDQWIVWCARKYGWPPDVTRRQSLRDLRLLNASEG